MSFDNLLAFIELGFTHILPRGLDHILFIVAVFLNAPDWRSLLLQASCFTLAHTITLGLVASGLMEAPAYLVEPLIALSIVVMALEAVVKTRTAVWRLPVVFCFGLFHGLAFGGEMKIYLDNTNFGVGLAGFTLGVELGQLVVLAASGLAALVASAALGAMNRRNLYVWVFVRPVAVLIAVAGLYWMIERIGPGNI
ncbi:MAG: HupE/UreJ family protein [Alphaproteobacteria bacterium]|nr:HupE/UreJ family protein [Alphaproteobacteria bacterium]